MGKTDNILLKYIPLVFSFIAILLTMVLTFQNIQFYQSQRKDTLNQLLYERKIDAGIEIINSLYEYLSLYPRTLALEDSVNFNFITLAELDTIEAKWQSLLMKVHDKWMVILPNKILRQYSEVIDSFTYLYARLVAIPLYKITGEKERLIVLHNDIIKRTKELRMQIVSFTNNYRSSLGIEKFDFETSKIVDLIDIE